MKCKACGQELAIDRTTGIGVCVGCNKKYKVSTIVKPKICSDCNVPLVNNGALWECPTCGKKYVFSGNKNKSARPEALQNASTEEPPKSETDWKEDLLNESFDDEETIDDSENNVQSQDRSEIQNNIEAENNPEQPSSETTASVATSEADNKSVDNSDIIDDVIVDDNIIDNKIIDDIVEPSTSTSNDVKPTEPISETVVEDDIEATDSEKTEAVADEVVAPINDFNVARNVEMESQNKPTVSEMPLLYDDDGAVYQNNDPKIEVKATNGGVRTLSQIGIPASSSKNKTQTKSIGAVVIAVILGILSTAAGIGCYLVSILQNLNVAEQMSKLFTTLQNITALVFFALFAVICFVVSAKPIGAKKVGTIMGGIFAVAMIVRRLLSMLIKSGALFDILEKHGNIITYSIYAVCIFASFFTMVISSKTDLQRKTTKAGIVFFVFSLLALFTVAIRMLPLESLNLSILEIAIPFMVEADKVLLAFGVMGLLSVIAKPKE